MVSPAASVDVTYWVLLSAARVMSIKARKVERNSRIVRVGAMLFSWEKAIAGSIGRRQAGWRTEDGDGRG